MGNLWKLGGLSFIELVRRTVRESWEDGAFGHGGGMAFYQFLAIFPALLALLAIVRQDPHLTTVLRRALQDLSNQTLPLPASSLFGRMTQELSGAGLSDWRLLTVYAGAIWAACNGTWAMVEGLNRAYEVPEDRSWRKLALIIGGLALAMTLAGCAASFLVLLGTYVHLFGQHSLAGRIAAWLVLGLLASLCFALLYRFGPNIPHAWQWSTPGAVCAVLLWAGSILAVRIYFEHVTDYRSSYGELNGAAILLLWLYVTNGAILIGGEMNSEIEKAALEPLDAPGHRGHKRKQAPQ